MAGRRGRAHNLSERGGATLLTPDLSEKLLAARKKYHLFDSQIAILCGVSPATLKRWLTWGVLPEAQDPFASFAEEYGKLQLEHEEHAVSAILEPPNEVQELEREESEGLPFGSSKRQRDWRGYAWYLERRFPKRWNPAMQAAGGPIDAIDFEQLIQAAEARQESLVEVLNDAPPELRAALRAAATAVRAVLDEPTEDAPPALPPAQP